MLEAILEYVKSNPMLAAGVGTVSLSSALFIMKSLPAKLLKRIKDSMISQLAVTTRNGNFCSIEDLIHNTSISWLFRNYEVSDTSDPAYITTGYGSGYGIWQGVLFQFRKNMLDNKTGIEKQINVNFFTRNKKVIEKFVAKASEQNQRTSQRIYGYTDYWRLISERPFRDMDTVFIDQDIKNEIVCKIDKFLSEEDFYQKRGIPYKLCMLLHGVPGTGKSSLIHAVASYLKYDLFYIDSLYGISDMLRGGISLGKNRVYVVEDIDNLAKLKRPEKKTNEPASGAVNYRTEGEELAESIGFHVLHDLMQTLDGFMTPHGMIIFITSNHPEQLDPALMRPGRVDLKREIGPLNFVDAQKMFFSFYGKENLHVWNQHIKNYVPTIGAQLQQCFMLNDPHEAMQSLLQSWHALGTFPHQQLTVITNHDRDAQRTV